MQMAHAAAAVAAAETKQQQVALGLWEPLFALAIPAKWPIAGSQISNCHVYVRVWVLPSFKFVVP